MSGSSYGSVADSSPTERTHVPKSGGWAPRDGRCPANPSMPVAEVTIAHRHESVPAPRAGTARSLRTAEDVRGGHDDYDSYYANDNHGRQPACDAKGPSRRLPQHPR